MTTKIDRAKMVALVLGLVLVMACTVTALPQSAPGPTATQTLLPTVTPLPTRTPLPPDTGWQLVHPGVEIRSLNVAVGEAVERVTIARLVPGQLRFRVLYSPNAPLPVSGWAHQTRALLVINGGYFTEAQEVTGLTISDGEIHGAPYGDYAGMFAVTDGGDVSVRWLRTWPYDATEPLQEAVQSFPVLVKPGGVMGFPVDADDGRPARRTVVAQDREGRLLFIIAPRGHLSLHELAVWMADSDLAINTALNMDGGTSSGFWLVDGPQIDSMISVPSVITVLASESAP